MSHKYAKYCLLLIRWEDKINSAARKRVLQAVQSMQAWIHFSIRAFGTEYFQFASNTSWLLRKLQSKMQTQISLESIARLSERRYCQLFVCMVCIISHLLIDRSINRDSKTFLPEAFLNQYVYISKAVLSKRFPV